MTRYSAYVCQDWLESPPSWLTVYDPSTDEAVGEIAELQPTVVDAAASSAAAAQRSWSRVPPAKRAEILTRTADLIDERAEEFVDLLAREGGRPQHEARGEVAKGSTTFRYYGGLVGALDGRAFEGGQEALRHETRHEPVGVVAAVTPWNVPIASPARKLAPALLAGNAVLLKPATATPISAHLMVRALYDAGLPDGVVQLLTGPGGSLGRAVCIHPSVGAVSFTGSTEVGLGIQQALAERTTKVQLELGGKNAAVVLPGADLERSADAVVAAAFASAGQQCTATSRLIAHQDVAQSMVSLVGKRIDKLTLGACTDPQTTMGPLIDDQQVTRVDGYVQRAVAEGAGIVRGGHRLERPGNFYAPTVVADVGPGFELAREEVFGPVLAVLTTDTAEAAAELVNDTSYGLSCAVHTRDLAEAHQFVSRVDCGVVAVNGATAGVELSAPFGGFKDSGTTSSKEHGPESMDFYTRTKLVSWRW